MINQENMPRFFNLQTLLFMPKPCQSKHLANRYDRLQPGEREDIWTVSKSSAWGDVAFAYIWSMSPLKGRHYAAH